MGNDIDIMKLSNRALIKEFNSHTKRFDELYLKTFMATAQPNDNFYDWLDRQDKQELEIAELVSTMNELGLLQRELARRRL